MTGHRDERKGSGAARSRRRAAVACLILFGTALAIRLLNLWFVSRASPFWLEFNTDDRVYNEWALRIASGTLSDGEPFFLAPLFAYALGLVYSLFGETGPLAAILLQTLLSALTCCFIARAGSLLFGERAGFAAGALAALYGPFIFFTEILLTETLHLFLATLAFWLLLRCRTTRGALPFALCGLVAGLAAATRTYYLLTALLLAAWIVVDRIGVRRIRGSNPGGGGDSATAPVYGPSTVLRPASVFRPAAFFIVGVLAIVAIPTAHNVLAGGDLVLVNSSGGVNFFMGNHAGADGRYHVPRGIPIESVQNPVSMRATFHRLAEEELRRELAPSEVSSHYFGKGISFVLDRPGEWFLLLLRKGGFVLESYEYPGDRNYYQGARFSPVLAWTPARYPLVLGLALIGLLAAWRRRSELLPLALTALAATTVLLAFYVTDRYRLVLVPTLLILAGAGASFLLDARTGGRRARTIAVLTAGAALFALSLLLPSMLTRDFRTESSMSLHNLGTRYFLKERYDEAEEALSESIRLCGGYLPARSNLALTLSQMPGRRDDAIAAWRIVLRLARQTGSKRYEERALKWLRLLGARPGRG